MFFDIEKLYYLNCKKINHTMQLDFELNFYKQGYFYSPDLFVKIRDLIFNEFNKTKMIFKLESEYLEKIFKISISIVKNTNTNYCYKLYTAELITNWLLLSFVNKIINKSYSTKKYIYIDRYALIDNIYKNLNNFFIYFDPTYTETQDDVKKYKFLIIQLIFLLCTNKLIYKTTVNKFFNNTKKSYLLIGIYLNKNYKNIYNINIYLSEPTLFESNLNTYFIGIHYSTLICIFKRNIRSNKYFELNDLTLLNHLKSLKYYINKELYKLIQKKILDDLGCSLENAESVINEKIDIILNSTNDIINKLNKSMFIDYKSKFFLFDDLNYNEDIYEVNNSFDFIDEIVDTPVNYNDYYYKQILDSHENFNESESINFKNDIINHYILYNLINEPTDLNKYYNYIIFLSLENYFNKYEYFYLTYSFDFRGRLYSNSYISPLGDKLFRYLYTYGSYSNEELENYKTIDINQMIINLFENSSIFVYYPNISIKNPIHLQYIYWGFFELGKIFKSNLLEKNKGCLNDFILIEYGIEIFKDYKTNKKNWTFEYWLEINNILIMFHYLNMNIYSKYIIFKDSTASGIQLLTVILGAKNENILKICNLNSNEFWYDTYYHIIEKFKESDDIKTLLIENNEIIHRLLTRKILKKITMVYGYNVSYLRGKEYYLNEVKQSFKNLEKSNINLKIISLVFSLYFKYLNSIFKNNEFFEVPLSLLLKEHKLDLKKFGKLKKPICDDSYVDFSYFHTINFELDRKYKKQRNRIKLTMLSSEIDELKTMRALIANLTHSTDAVYVRYILKYLNKPIITIHDCFGIDILNVNLLLKCANYSINKIYYLDNSNVKNDKKIVNYYSKYILI